VRKTTDIGLIRSLTKGEEGLKLRLEIILAKSIFPLIGRAVADESMGCQAKTTAAAGKRCKWLRICRRDWDGGETLAMLKAHQVNSAEE